MERFWVKRGITREPCEREKEELKSFLTNVDEQGGLMTPGMTF